MGDGAAQVGYQAANHTEVRRPANIGDGCDQNLTGLQRSRLGQRVSNPGDTLDDTARSGASLQNPGRRIDGLGFQRLRPAHGDFRKFQLLLELERGAAILKDRWRGGS